MDVCPSPLITGPSSPLLALPRGLLCRCRGCSAPAAQHRSPRAALGLTVTPRQCGRGLLRLSQTSPVSLQKALLPSSRTVSGSPVPAPHRPCPKTEMAPASHPVSTMAQEAKPASVPRRAAPPSWSPFPVLCPCAWHFHTHTLPNFPQASGSHAGLELTSSTAGSSFPTFSCTSC